MQENKYRLLRNGLIMDAIGVATMFIPVGGMVIDLFWAPFAAKKMNDWYSGTSGKIASMVVFLEEILPGLDVIPTFTLMWLYTFVLAPKRNTSTETLEVEILD
ncbi:hypothetical protein [Aureitalea marina]|uniref:DUF4112 domain-containing protein n=1 Tax=Aureitalea marina TaxID=930804 RepID=A0A2S7KPI7_9FLAO|nr:hypothetical protein [Aureitalea marina]PQB04483.1 hypothetical protein BST85_05885 [Aureitalea marina]